MSQDQIIRDALEAVQARERAEPVPNPQEGMNRAMGGPSDLVSGSIGGSMIEAVEASLRDPWTAIVFKDHEEVPDGTVGPPQGAVMLMIYAMELGREIGKREHGS